MKDRISQLMDGELDDASAALTIEALARDPEAREAWRTYHLISDALAKSRMLSPGFGERVAAALAEEPTVVAPTVAPKAAPGRLRPAEPRRWVAIAAGLAAVSLVAWLGFAPQHTAVAPVAQAPQPVAQAPQPAVVPLPSRTSDYLLAHQGFAPSLQGMAPYVRLVSEQAREPAR